MQPRKYEIKKSSFKSISIVTAVLTATLGLPVASANAAPVVLKAAFYQPDGNPIVELAKESMRKIEKETDGRVKFEVFASSTLIPTVEMASGVDEGIAFLANWYMPYMAKTIPLFEIETLPVWTSGTCDAIVKTYDNGLNEIYAEALKRQGLPNIKVAGVSMCEPRTLLTKTSVKVPLNTKGMNIRSVGSEADMFRGIGANPVNMTMEQTYEALSRGVIDGLTNSTAVFYDRHMFELAKYVNNMGLTYVLMHVIYNPDLLKPLDTKDRETVERGMVELSAHVRNGLIQQSSEKIGRAKEELKVDIYEPTDAEHQQWVAAATGTRKTFEDKASKDDLIKSALTLLYKFNPKIED